jgi:arylsulfatase A-like enzyme
METALRQSPQATLSVLQTSSLFAAVLAGFLAYGGCSGPTGNSPPDARDPTTAKRPTADRVQKPQPRPSPHDGSGANVDQETSDDAEAREDAGEARNPLTRGIRKLLDASPVLDDKEDLGHTLSQADQLLADMKQENRDAIRDLNREVKVGPNRAPNVLLILAHELGYGDLACYGQEEIQTPHLDRLANDGMRFTDFYAGGASAEATRWCLLLGADTSRARRGKQLSFVLRSEAVTLPEVLWQAGYDTGFIGLWGLGQGDERMQPHLHGFDEWQGMREGTELNPDQLHYPETLWADGAPLRVAANAQGKRGQFASDFYVQEVAAYVGKHASKRSKPFFLMVAFPLPSGSQAVPSVAPYEASDRPAAAKAHAAAVTRLDRDVGLLLKRLQDAGLAGNTLVLFTSDSGPRRSDEDPGDLPDGTGGLKGGQGSLYEGGIRVPLIARWPQHVPPGTVSSYPAAVWDLLPTLADVAAAARRPRNLDGVSLAPVLRGRAGKSRELLYWESIQGGSAQAVRKGVWKVVRPAGKTGREHVELYNLRDDPGEQKNVAGQHPDVLDQLIKS